MYVGQRTVYRLFVGWVGIAVFLRLTEGLQLLLYNLQFLFRIVRQVAEDDFPVYRVLELREVQFRQRLFHLPRQRLFLSVGLRCHDFAGIVLRNGKAFFGIGAVLLVVVDEVLRRLRVVFLVNLLKLEVQLLPCRDAHASGFLVYAVILRLRDDAAFRLCLIHFRHRVLLLLLDVGKGLLVFLLSQCTAAVEAFLLYLDAQAFGLLLGTEAGFGKLSGIVSRPFVF